MCSSSGDPPVGTCWTLSGKIVWTLSRCAPPVGTTVHRCHSGLYCFAPEPRVVVTTWLASQNPLWLGGIDASQTPAFQKGGGLYIGSPNEKGCHQGASSPCEFPTITVPGHPSPLRGETGDQCFFLLSIQHFRHYGIADYHQRRSPGLKSVLGGGIYRRQTP